MKITTKEGEFELVPHTLANDEIAYSLQPVKKTEKKEEYYISFQRFNSGDNERLLDVEDLDLTPTTADKLSEAVSALVEYVTEKEDKFSDVPYIEKADAAREHYQKSQNN